ncbi:MAG: polysaccharide deacetylase family protein [Dysgonomonas sp.]
MKHKLLFLLFLLAFWCGASQAAIVAPNLEVKGTNFEIAALTEGAQTFLNRPAMLLKTIPTDFAGWKFTRINGNSTYLPGPLPTLSVKSATAGDIYVMVSNLEKPDICAQWATTNGWTLVDGYSLTYGTNAQEKFAFYKKTVAANTWVSIVQPNVFSGAVVIAPNLTIEGQTPIQAVSVSIESIGSMTTDILKTGALAYNNRTYVYGTIPAAISGNMFTRYNGGAAPALQVTPQADGDLYIAVSSEDKYFDVSEWTKIDGITFGYNDPTSTTFTLYKKAVVKDQVISLKTTSWQGILVISPSITYTTITDFVPPPGVVIHNSKAATKIYIGSPSIVVMADGTYLASHDYFGTRTETFVYKSTDRGKTWTGIAEILDLKWSTIFRRGNEVYLLGVRVNGTEYGNTVILKSLDAGVTWTDPTDSSTGLLLQGYYHCAPVPVTIHNGKYWRAMEERGEPNGSWGNFKAFMMSVDENADLLNAANWTFSNRVVFDAGPGNYGNAWLEGNAVVAKDGSMKDILRVNYSPDNIAAIVDVAPDGKTASFNSSAGFVSLPGALKKFTIRYDSISNKYWTLSNFVLDESKALSSNNERIRNTIVLSWSDDLRTWNIKDTLLHHPDVNTHGFQYLDWLFDGNDIIAVSRTAWEDETGQADSQHNANYVTFHRFRNFRFERIGSSSEASVKKWYNNVKSAIALTFDDGFKAHYDYAYPILQANDIPATFFVNSGNLVNKGQTQKERYGYWEDFKTMSDNGYEVASHSLTHPNLTTASYDVLINELKKDKQNIETNIGKPCLTHAYPSCLHNETVDNVAASLFIAGRQCGGLSNAASLSGTQWFSVNSDLLTWTYPRSIDNENASIADFKTQVDNDLIANNNFGVACIHEVLPFDLLSTSSTYEIATTEWLNAVCAYLKDKKATGEIWPTTFSNVVRYAQERDNLRLEIKVLEDGSRQYTFGDNLEDSIFNVPVTVDIVLPTETDSVKCTVYDGNVILSEVNYPSSAGKVTLNIVPDKYTVVLKALEYSGIEINSQAGWRCYPNPVKDVLYVESDGSLSGLCTIVDPAGRLMAKKQLRFVGAGLASIDMKGYANGLYIVNFKTNDGKTYSSKIVKK